MEMLSYSRIQGSFIVWLRHRVVEGDADAYVEQHRVLTTLYSDNFTSG